MTENLAWLAGQWLNALESAVETMTGLKAGARLEQQTLPPDGLVWALNVDGQDRARILVSVPPVTTNCLGRSLLSAAGLADAGGDEIRGALIEILQQSLSPLAQALERRAGREIRFAAGREADLIPPDARCAGVVLLIAGEELPLSFGCTAELLDLIPQPARAAAPESAPKALPSPGAQPGQGSRTFDLLLEVEMPVGVSFGRAQMRLKDAIKLTTGSIVELNRSITEPVELVVNNCVIARGEVVVVEGNYGVRIREIISREERLRTLF